MAQIHRDDHLDKILKENPKKLICVLFGNPDFPPCAKAHNLWDKLAPKYSTCIFIYAECDKCQTEARRQEIKQIPTVIFYKNQSILNRIVGVEENEILQFIEENRPLGAFDGSSHKIGPPSAGNTFSQKPQPPKPKQDTNTNTQPKAQPKNSISDVRRQLLELQFPLSVIDKAIQATNFGTVEECLDYITQEQAKAAENQADSTNTEPQLNPESSQNKSGSQATPVNTPSQPNQPNPSKTSNPPSNQSSGPQSAGPKRMLSPAAKAMKEQLLDFGYQEEEIDKAIGIVGTDSIDKLIDCITRLQSGEDSAAIAQQQIQEQKQRLSPEELNKRAEELKQRTVQKEIEKQKAAPKLEAQKEMERRKEVLMQVELKRQQDERKKQLDLEVARKQKIQDKIERERVKAMIAKQRGQRNEDQPKASQNAPPPAHKTPTECTLKIVIPGDKDLILKFSPEARFSEVDQKVKSERPNILGSTTYVSAFPRKQITSADFDKNVTELGLMPRTMLTLNLS